MTTTKTKTTTKATKARNRYTGLDCTGDGCIYDPATHTVSPARTEPLFLQEHDLAERVVRAQFQLSLLKSAIKDMNKILAGGSFRR